MEKLWEDPYKDGILEMKKHQKPCGFWADEFLHEDPDNWYLELVQLRALRLWKGEQVDGTVMEPWGWPEFPDEPKYILGLPRKCSDGWLAVLDIVRDSAAHVARTDALEFVEQRVLDMSL